MNETGVKKILLLGYDPGLLRSLQDELLDKRFQLDCIQSFEDCLEESLEALNPDIILISVEISSLEGLDLCLRVRQISPTPVLALRIDRTVREKVRRLDLGTDSGFSELLSFSDVIRRIEEATS